MDSRASRREFLNAAGISATAAVLGGAAHAQTKQDNHRPNVIVILVDDLGYGDLGCYGAPDIKSPNIDGLMTQGMRFDRFYANCPVCSPTRASVLTGRYPDFVGVPGVIRTHRANSWGYLDPNAVLLPEVLKSAGYHTAIVGKWHLGLESPNTPTERGFDFFHGFLDGMMEDYYQHLRQDQNYMRLNRDVITPEGHATDLFTDWSIEYIHERAETVQPFFLYLAYTAPHAPIQPPEDWLARVKQREPGISEDRAKLVALIEHMDDGIGRVMRALEESGAGDNTLIVFTSDNGGDAAASATNGALRGAKQDMYEGGIREPACAVWPGHITPGARTDAITLTMDLFPTLCEIGGAEFNHDIDGQSFLPTLLGESQDLDDRLLFWVRREGGRYNGRAYYAAREGDWKLLQNSPFEEMELYNLADDPLEEHPLPRDHAMYKKLYQAVSNHINTAGAVPWQPPGVVSL